MTAIKAWAVNWYWSVRSVVMGRTYYANGSSERASRWWVLKMHSPLMSWGLRHGRRKPCGCSHWPITRRPILYCMEHSGLAQFFSDSEEASS